VIATAEVPTPPPPPAPVPAAADAAVAAAFEPPAMAPAPVEVWEPEVGDRVHQTLIGIQHDREPAAVLLVGLDDEASDAPLNDEALLAEIEGRLHRIRRRTDVVVRVDGGRFVVVCTHVDSPADADRVAESVVDELTGPVPVGTVERQVRATLGVVLTGTEAQAPEVLLANAELALRCAQAEERPWRLFDDTVEENLRLRDRLRSAIAEGELNLEFQPVVDLLTFETVGAEALVRWHRPGQEVLRAADFLADAYSAGLAAPLGRWVLNRAVSELSSWRVLGRAREGFRMWVNVSAEELGDHEFAGTVEKLTRENGVTPAMVSLEVPESALSDAAAVEHALHALSELGVAFVIDDFGTGGSDLRCLRDLPVTGVKIAPELVASLDTAGDRRGPGLVRGLIALGHELRLDVVAEGVETESQAMALRSLGCDLAQGYFFGRPGPPEDLWERPAR